MTERSIAVQFRTEGYQEVISQFKEVRDSLNATVDAAQKKLDGIGLKTASKSKIQSACKGFIACIKGEAKAHDDRTDTIIDNNNSVVESYRKIGKEIKKIEQLDDQEIKIKHSIKQSDSKSNQPIINESRLAAKIGLEVGEEIQARQENIFANMAASLEKLNEGNFLGAIGGLLTKPIQDSVTGYYEGFGQIFGNEMAFGAKSTIEHELGFDFQVNGKRLGTVISGFVNHARNGVDSVVDQLEQAFIGIGGKSLEIAIDIKTGRSFNDIAADLANDIKNGVTEGFNGGIDNAQNGIDKFVNQIGQKFREATNPANVAKRRRERFLSQNGRNLVDEAQSSDEGQKFREKVDPSKQSIVIVSGGFAGIKGRAGSLVKREIEKVARPEDTQYISNRTPFTEIERGGGFGESTKQIIRLFSKIAQQGYNPDAIDLASKALIAREQAPESEIKLAGYSGGGYVVEEALRIIEIIEGNLDSISGLGIGTPNIPGGIDPTDKASFQKILGTNDPIMGTQIMRDIARDVKSKLGIEIFTELNDELQNLEGIDDHALDQYLTNSQETLDFLYGDKFSQYLETLLQQKSKVDAASAELLAIAKTGDQEATTKVMLKYFKQLELLLRDSKEFEQQGFAFGENFAEKTRELYRKAGITEEQLADLESQLDQQIAGVQPSKASATEQAETFSPDSEDSLDPWTNQPRRTQSQLEQQPLNVDFDQSIDPWTGEPYQIPAEAIVEEARVEADQDQVAPEVEPNTEVTSLGAPPARSRTQDGGNGSANDAVSFFLNLLQSLEQGVRGINDGMSLLNQTLEGMYVDMGRANASLNSLWVSLEQLSKDIDYIADGLRAIVASLEGVIPSSETDRLIATLEEIRRGLLETFDLEELDIGEGVNYSIRDVFNELLAEIKSLVDVELEIGAAGERLSTTLDEIRRGLFETFDLGELGIGDGVNYSVRDSLNELFTELDSLTNAELNIGAAGEQLAATLEEVRQGLLRTFDLEEIGVGEGVDRSVRDSLNEILSEVKSLINVELDTSGVGERFNATLEEIRQGLLKTFDLEEIGVGEGVDYSIRDSLNEILVELKNIGGQIVSQLSSLTGISAQDAGDSGSPRITKNKGTLLQGKEPIAPDLEGYSGEDAKAATREAFNEWFREVIPKILSNLEGKNIKFSGNVLVDSDDLKEKFKEAAEIRKKIKSGEINKEEGNQQLRRNEQEQSRLNLSEYTQKVKDVIVFMVPELLQKLKTSSKPLANELAGAIAKLSEEELTRLIEVATPTGFDAQGKSVRAPLNWDEFSESLRRAGFDLQEVLNEIEENRNKEPEPEPEPESDIEENRNIIDLLQEANSLLRKIASGTIIASPQQGAEDNVVPDKKDESDVPETPQRPKSELQQEANLAIKRFKKEQATALIQELLRSGDIELSVVDDREKDELNRTLLEELREGIRQLVFSFGKFKAVRPDAIAISQPDPSEVTTETARINAESANQKERREYIQRLKESETQPTIDAIASAPTIALPSSVVDTNDAIVGLIKEITFLAQSAPDIDSQSFQAFIDAITQVDSSRLQEISQRFSQGYVDVERIGEALQNLETSAGDFLSLLNDESLINVDWVQEYQKALQDLHSFVAGLSGDDSFREETLQSYQDAGFSSQSLIEEGKGLIDDDTADDSLIPENLDQRRKELSRAIAQGQTETAKALAESLLADLAAVRQEVQDREGQISLDAINSGETNESGNLTNKGQADVQAASKRIEKAGVRIREVLTDQINTIVNDLVQLSEKEGFADLVTPSQSAEVQPEDALQTATQTLQNLQEAVQQNQSQIAQQLAESAREQILQARSLIDQEQRALSPQDMIDNPDLTDQLDDFQDYADQLDNFLAEQIELLTRALVQRYQDQLEQARSGTGETNLAALVPDAERFSNQELRGLFRDIATTGTPDELKARMNEFREAVQASRLEAAKAIGEALLLDLQSAQFIIEELEQELIKQSEALPSGERESRISAIREGRQRTQQSLSRMRNEVVRGGNAPGQVPQGLSELAELPDFQSLLEEQGENAAQGLSEGMRSQADDVEDAGRDLGRSAQEGAEDELDIGSPSKVFARIGRFIVEGLMQGFDANRDRMQDIPETINDAVNSVDAEQVAENTADAFNGAAESVAEGVEDVADSASEAGSNAAEVIEEELEDTGEEEGLFERVKGQFDEATDGIIEKISGFNEDLGGFAQGIKDNLGDFLLGFVEVAFLGEIIGRMNEFAGVALEAAGALEALESSFIETTGAIEKGRKELRQATGIAQEYGVALGVARDAAIGLEAATKDTTLEGEQADKIQEAFSKIAIDRGLDSQAQGRVFTALTQIVSKGRLQAEEVRQQLGDALPGFEQLVASALGVNTAELDEMMRNGELLADEVLPKIAAQINETNAVMSSSTLNKELTRFNNSMTLILEAYGNALIGPARDGLALVNSGLSSIAENIGKIARLTPSITGAITFRWIQSVLSLVGSLPPAPNILAQIGTILWNRILPAMTKLLAKFVLIEATIRSVSNVFDVFRLATAADLRDDLKKVELQVDRVREAFAEVNEEKKKLSENRVQENSDLKLGEGLFGVEGLNLDNLVRRPLKKLEEMFRGGESGIVTAAESRQAAIIAQVDEQVARTRELLEFQQKALKEVEAVKAIDAQLKEIKSQQFELEAGDKEEQQALLEKQRKLLEIRDEILEKTTAFQMAINGTLDANKDLVESLKDDVASGKITESVYEQLIEDLEPLSEEIEETEEEYNEALSELTDKTTELGDRMERINAELRAFKENQEREQARRRNQIMSRGLDEGIPQDEIDKQLRELETEGLGKMIGAVTDKLQRVTSDLNADVLSPARSRIEGFFENENLPINNETLEKLLEEQRDSQEKKVIEAMLRQRGLQQELLDLQNQYYDSALGLRKESQEAAKGLADFIENLREQLAEVTASLKQLKLDLGFSKISRTLKNALSPGTDSFVSGVVGEVQGWFDEARSILGEFPKLELDQFKLLNQEKSLEEELQGFKDNINDAASALERFTSVADDVGRSGVADTSSSYLSIPTDTTNGDTPEKNIGGKIEGKPLPDPSSPEQSSPVTSASAETDFWGRLGRDIRLGWNAGVGELQEEWKTLVEGSTNTESPTRMGFWGKLGQGIRSSLDSGIGELQDELKILVEGSTNTEDVSIAERIKEGARNLRDAFGYVFRVPSQSEPQDFEEYDQQRPEGTPIRERVENTVDTVKDAFQHLWDSLNPRSKPQFDPDDDKQSSLQEGVLVAGDITQLRGLLAKDSRQPSAFPLQNQSIENATITSDFGWRTIFGRKDFHEGLDLAAQGGDPVMAVNTGIVKQIKPLADQAQIMVESINGAGQKIQEWYIHLAQKPPVGIGDRVESGQKIGEVAHTSQVAKNAGVSTGDHLDYRVMRNGDWIDPKNYLREIKAQPVATPVERAAPQQGTINLDTESIIQNRLQEAEFTPSAIAAVLGTFKQESALNPSAVNPSSGATGLAQWLGDRKASMPAITGDKVTDLNNQIDYFLAELNGQNNEGQNGVLLDILTTTSNLEKAMEAMNAYERFLGYKKRENAEEAGRRYEFAREFVQRQRSRPQSPSTLNTPATSIQVAEQEVNSLNEKRRQEINLKRQQASTNLQNFVDDLESRGLLKVDQIISEGIEQSNEQVNSLKDSYNDLTGEFKDSNAFTDLQQNLQKVNEQFDQQETALKKRKEALSDQLTNISDFQKGYAQIEKQITGFIQQAKQMGASTEPFDVLLESVRTVASNLESEVPLIKLQLDQIDNLLGKLPDDRETALSITSDEGHLQGSQEVLNSRKEIIDLNNQIKQQQADLLENAGYQFQAQALREQVALKQQELKVEQQILDIRKQYGFTDRAEELIEKILKLNDLEIDGIDRQFKNLGETIRDISKNQLENFFNSIFTNVSSVGDAFRGLVTSILKGIAQIFAKKAAASLFSLFGFADGGTVEEYRYGGTVLNYASGGTVDSIDGTEVPRFADGETVINYTEGGTVDSEDVKDSPEEVVETFVDGGEVSERKRQVPDRVTDRLTQRFPAFRRGKQKEGAKGKLAFFTPGEEILSLKTGEAQRYQAIKAELGRNPLEAIFAGNFKNGGTIGTESLERAFQKIRSDLDSNPLKPIYSGSALNMEQQLASKVALDSPEVKIELDRESAQSRRRNNASNNRPIIINNTINTPNADSFRRSEGQMATETEERLKRAQKRNG